MLTPSSDTHQTNLFGQDLLLQLDPGDPLYQLASAIPWGKFDQDFAVHYTKPDMQISASGFRTKHHAFAHGTLPSRRDRRTRLSVS